MGVVGKISSSLHLEHFGFSTLILFKPIFSFPFLISYLSRFFAQALCNWDRQTFCDLHLTSVLFVTDALFPP